MRNYISKGLVFFFASSLIVACKTGDAVEGTDQMIGAVVRNDPKEVRQLIASGADVNLHDVNGVTPLALSARLCHGEVSGLLLSMGADPNFQSKMNDDIRDGGYTPVIWAIINADTKTLKLMLENAGDLNKASSEGDSPLIYAVRGGLLDIVDLLVKGGASLGYKNPYSGVSALIEAVISGHGEILEYLINKGMDLNSRDNQGNTLVMIAAEKAQLAELMYLIEKGLDLKVRNNSGDTALHLAIGDNWTNLRVQEFLFSKGADVDEGNREGLTPIMEAAYRGYPKTVGLLIDHGAEANSVDKTGDTPLHYAAKGYKDTREIIFMLIRAGADLNAANAEGNTPLILACKHAGIDVVSALLAAKADCNAQNKWGWTALMEAARAGKLDLVKKMVESGADPSRVNKEGKTAAAIAKEFGHGEVFEYLSNAALAEGPQQ